MKTIRMKNVACVCALAMCSYQAYSADQSSFTGLKVGATAGVSHNSVDYAGYIGDRTNSKNDFVGGVNIEYGIPSGKDVVIAIGASYDLNSTKLDSTTYQNGGSTVYVNGKLKDHWSVYVAPGMRVNPKLLGYAKLGYHHAKSEYTDSLVGSGTSNHNGVGVGAGLTYAITRNVELNGELQHISFSRESFALSSGKPAVTQLTLGVNYRF